MPNIVLKESTINGDRDAEPHDEDHLREDHDAVPHDNVVVDLGDRDADLAIRRIVVLNPTIQATAMWVIKNNKSCRRTSRRRSP